MSISRESRLHVAAYLNPFGSIAPVVIGTGLLVLAACAGGVGERSGDWESEIATEGNVTTVRTISGSIWDGEARLVEEASIGEADGDDNYLLGNIGSLCAHDGRIFLLDRQVPAVRVYDWNGRWIRNIGREGSGPGELRMPTCVRVNPVDGRIFVRDGSAGRLNVYSFEGESLDTWPIRSGYMTSRQLIVTPAGRIWSPTWKAVGGEETILDYRDAMAVLTPEGFGPDTLLAPVFEFEEWRIEIRGENQFISNNVPFAPASNWVMTPLGTMVGGVSDEYRFDIYHPDGRIVRIEKEWERIPVTADERSWHRARATANMRGMQEGWAWNGPDLPNHKPPFEDFLTDADGRIWVIRPGPGVLDPDAPARPEDRREFWSHPRWHDSYFIDVFDHEGRFLGSLDIPEGFETYPEPYIAGQTVIALTTDAAGVPRVKRYRLVLPEEGGE